METIYIKNISQVTKNQAELEQKLKVKLTFNGKNVSFEGEALDEFTAHKVLEALAFGFSAKKSLSLINEEFMFKKVHIKDFTRRNLKSIKSRIIGTRGKTKKTISEISSCDIIVKESDVGFIGESETVLDVEQAIINLIKGSKQSNMYSYLQRRNRERNALEN